jgi:hypothetical protein
VLVTRSKALLQKPEIAMNSSKIDDIRGLPVWTDDFNNLFQILK